MNPEEVRAICLDKNIDPISKIARIYKMTGGYLPLLAGALNIPEEMLSDEFEIKEEFQLIGEMPGEKIPNSKDYSDAFWNAYKVVTTSKDNPDGIAYKFKKADWGQFKNIIGVVGFEDYKKILEYYIEQAKLMKEGRMIEVDMKNIINKISPAKIYIEINYLLRKIKGQVCVDKHEFEDFTTWNGEENKT